MNCLENKVLTSDIGTDETSGYKTGLEYFQTKRCSSGQSPDYARAVFLVTAMTTIL
jgi:hypothetical protein